MARIARVVIPGLAHHVTQRGNGRQQTFFGDADYRLYLRLLRRACAHAEVQCLAFCLMPNHTHLILVPTTPDGLARCLSRVHRPYATMLNRRQRRSGHFWQGRYGSVVMDAPHLLEAFRYVLLNPVRAQLVTSALAWRWSSAGAYLAGRVDGLTDTAPLKAEIANVDAFLRAAPNLERVQLLRRQESTGRPAVSPEVLLELEARTRRRLGPRPPGPVPRG